MEKEKRYPEKGEEGREAWELKVRARFCAMCRAVFVRSRMAYYQQRRARLNHEAPFSAFKEGLEFRLGYNPRYDFERRPRKLIYRVGDLAITSEMICKAFGALSEVQKKAVFMRHIKGLSIKEIARIEKEKYTLVSGRIQSGVAKMRKILETEGIKNAEKNSTAGFV